MVTDRFPGYPIHVVDEKSYHPKHPLYPVRVYAPGRIVLEAPSFSTHPVFSIQVVELSDLVKEYK